MLATLRRRWTVMVLVGAVTASLAACGGEEEAERSGEVAERVERAAPLGDSGETTEEATSYEPTGEIVADSGFRPDVDGFSFPNYGNEVEPQNLTPANVESLFGEQVCVSGTGEDCVLTPAGEKWMEAQNETMAAGHCMGFSVASLRMFGDTLPETDFGAETANDLELQGNVDLQATIAESFVYQSIDNITKDTIRGTPSEVLEALIDVLNTGEDLYTLGFYKRDGTAGHAMTPIAVEDKGDGQFAILVYDNNYPDTVQAMEIDTNADTYRYEGAVNPGVEPDVYDGDADTVPLELIPTLPGEELQPCPFCDGDLAEDGASEEYGTTLGAGQQYGEITLTGDVANHPHLVLTTEDGKRTGIIDGELVNEIEGVQVVQQYADDPTVGQPEPKFRIPLGTQVTVSVDGSDLDGVSRDVSIDYTGDGKVISAEDFDVAPGQVDTLYIPGDEAYGLVYETQAEDGVAPTFFVGVDEEDASYTLGATALNLEKGSLLGFIIDQETGQVLFDASDAEGVDGEAQVIAAVGRLDESGEEAWVGETTLDTEANEDLYVNYEQQELTPGRPIDLEIGPEDGPFRTVEAEYQE